MKIMRDLDPDGIHQRATHKLRRRVYVSKVCVRSIMPFYEAGNSSFFLRGKKEELWSHTAVWHAVCNKNRGQAMARR